MKIDLSQLPYPTLDMESVALSAADAFELVEEDCNNFLKSRTGLSYLCMKYPNLSVSETVDKYINNALWIDSIV
jgi:hypothetical protein